MKPGELIAVPWLTFANEKVLERADLQRLLCARIDTIADDVLTVAEDNDLGGALRPPQAWRQPGSICTSTRFARWATAGA